MKDIFIDCQLGISSDMLLAALIDLGVPIDIINESISYIDSKYNLVFKESISHGFRGLKLSIDKAIRIICWQHHQLCEAQQKPSRLLSRGIPTT